MTRHPASFGQFLTGAAYAVGVVQVGVLGLVAVLALGHSLATASKSGFEPPAWLGLVDAAASLAAVAFIWALYRRGDLDAPASRRRR